MFLEIRHLRSLLAIKHCGNLARAATSLHVTQSALSHQIKAVEDYFSTPLYLRSSKPLRLTPAGQKLVELAEQVLPVFETMERDLKRISEGKAGRLHIAIECHACYEWLLPVLEAFRERWPEVEVDILLGVSFEAIPALQRGNVDLVITSDPVETHDITFVTLFDYEALFAVSPNHPLAQRDFVEPVDLASETLLTYPVDRSRLDVFSHFLQPAEVEPQQVRQVELTAMILLLVASERGVAVLPDWVLQENQHTRKLATLPLGKEGKRGTVHAAVRNIDRETQFYTEFIELARAAGERV